MNLVKKRPKNPVIARDGEAKAIGQGPSSDEPTQETWALLEVLALGNRQIESGQASPVAEVFARLRERRQP